MNTQNILFFLTTFLSHSHSFTSIPRRTNNCKGKIQPRNKPTSLQASYQEINLPSTITSTEYFDGSSILHPVVVSQVYWETLKSSIVTVVIGECVAAIAFFLLVFLFFDPIRTFTSDLALKLPVVSPNEFREEGVVTGLNNRKAKIKPDFTKLLLSLTIDTIGSSSELVPVFGEISDIVWAPIAALLLRSLYGSNVVFVFEFIEEILPFTDILPLATICWCVETFYSDSDVATLLQIGTTTRNNGSVDVDVDVD